MVFVDLWGGPDSVDTRLHAWTVPASDEGNVALDPVEQTVALGGEFELGLSWTGLDADARYMGTVDFSADGEYVGSTVLNIAT